jgi:hypothetical protein
MDRELQGAWDRSLPDGKSQEQGAVLMADPASPAKWRAGGPGESGSWSPNYDDELPEERAIGTAHTHPYDASEGGLEDVTFSGQDLARFAVVPDRVQVVQSGSSRFVVSRSREFDKMLDGLDRAGRTRLFDQINKAWNDVFLSAKGSLQARAEKAVQATARRFHLLYYRGQAATLRRAGR